MPFDIFDITDIDGSLLEGGGQILRIALTLSAITHKPIRVRNIRGKRSKPGLMEQHLKGVQLIRDMTDGVVKGAHKGSTEITFHPGPLTGGFYSSEIQTAGSISLLLQVALPCALYADGETQLNLKGGTNTDMAPSIDYTGQVFKAVLERFGATFHLHLIQRGYFPRGGGRVAVTVTPITCLNAVQMEDFGKVKTVQGSCIVSKPSCQPLAEPMAQAAKEKLQALCGNVTFKAPQLIETSTFNNDKCVQIMITAQTTTDCFLGVDILPTKNEIPKNTGSRAADEMLHAAAVGACLDDHCQDQVIVLMALAEGVSKFRVGKITMHTYTAIYVCELLLKVKFEVTSYGDYSIIECRGSGLYNKQK